MKIVKVNDSLLINIEQIYSLEKHNNNTEIEGWEDEYKNSLNEYLKDPPEFILTGGIFFKPNLDVDNDPKLMELYIEKLNQLIYEDIGTKPFQYETYKVILSTGLTISIDKNIYDKIYKYLEKYIEKLDS